MIGLIELASAAVAQESAESELLTTLPPHQKYVAIALAVMMLAVVIELVRKRKLREEYSVLWISTAVLLMALALQPQLLNLFCRAIGATTPIPALLFGGLVFLMLVSLLASMRLSRLTARSKALSQQVALQQRELEELRLQVDRLRRHAGMREEKLVRTETDKVAKDGAA